jgi:hypothetical protein
MPGNDGRTLVMVPNEIEAQPVRTPVTADHTPDQPDEIARAERAEADRHAAEERADQAHKRADVLPLERLAGMVEILRFP